MSKKNDLHGRFDDMVNAVLAPPPEDRKDRKPVRTQIEREKRRTDERRGTRKNSRRR